MTRAPLFLRSLIGTFALLSLAAAGQQPPSPSKPETEASPKDLLRPDIQHAIDKAVSDILAQTGAPSASIAVVKDGKLAYAHAYGWADVETHKPATTAMHYSIGSISKQFTATAVLLLAEEGKLSLDDKVGRWLPKVTRAGDVTVRQLLSMTSGYQDYWPQDYVMPNMMKPTSAQEIVAGWAGKPLDFDPGAKWQYSNTNYVMAGLIVEKTAGMLAPGFSAETHLRVAADEECVRHRCRTPPGGRSKALSAVWSRPRSARAEGREGLDVRRR